MKECCRCAYYQTVSRWIALPRQWLVRVVETARVQTKKSMLPIRCGSSPCETNGCEAPCDREL